MSHHRRRADKRQAIRRQLEAIPEVERRSVLRRFEDLATALEREGKLHDAGDAWAVYHEAERALAPSADRRLR